MTLAREIMRLHNLSNSWPTLAKRYYPDAFEFRGRRLYCDPSKIWFRNRELNKIYNAKFLAEIEDIHQRLDHYLGKNQAGELLARLAGRNKNSWRTFLNKGSFAKKPKSFEFMAHAPKLISQAESYLKSKNLLHLTFDSYYEAYDLGVESDEISLELKKDIFKELCIGLDNCTE